MKILQIYPGKVWGGAEQYILDLSTELAKRGHTVIPVCLNTGVVEDTLKRHGINPITIPQPSLTGNNGVATSLSTIFDNADIVNIHSKKFISVAERAIKKCRNKSPRIVLTRHEARGSRVSLLFRKRYLKLDGMIFVSQLAHDLWTGANSWFPATKLGHVVLNSVAPPRQNNVQPIREKFNISPHSTLLVTSGRIRKSKGCETILRALALIKDLDYSMVFVGSCKPADYDKHLMDIADQFGIVDRIYFYGFSDSVDTLIADADIGLQPSIVVESCGLSVMEFMQAGKPVVTTNNGAQKEYLKSGETGILVPPDDAEVLSREIACLINNPQKREHIGRKAQESFNANNSYKMFVDRIEDTYKRIISPKS